jgi:hypothetical protein
MLAEADDADPGTEVPGMASAMLPMWSKFVGLGGGVALGRDPAAGWSRNSNT